MGKLPETYNDPSLLGEGRHKTGRIETINPFTAKVAKGKFRPNFQISFSKILTNNWQNVTVQAESFHLNGHIIGFRPQTQKLESPYKTPSNTLAVKGLTNLFS